MRVSKESAANLAPPECQQTLDLLRSLELKGSSTQNMTLLPPIYRDSQHEFYICRAQTCEPGESEIPMVRLVLKSRIDSPLGNPRETRFRKILFPEIDNLKDIKVSRDEGTKIITVWYDKIAHTIALDGTVPRSVETDFKIEHALTALYPEKVTDSGEGIYHSVLVVTTADNTIIGYRQYEPRINYQYKLDPSLTITSLKILYRAESSSKYGKIVDGARVGLSADVNIPYLFVSIKGLDEPLILSLEDGIPGPEGYASKRARLHSGVHQIRAPRPLLSRRTSNEGIPKNK